jgi:cyclase
MSAAMTETALREVADGVYAHVQSDGSWWINNSGLIVEGEDAVVIDTCATRARAEAFRRRIDEAGAPAPSRVVNTHAHGDHTYGNAVFPEATIIAHEGCRAAMLADPVRWSSLRESWTPTPEWSDLELRLPTVTINQPITLWCGERELRVRPLGKVAHTDHDLVIELDEVAFVGDLVFSGGTPLFLSGSLTGYLEVVPYLRSLAPRLLVSGHGEPCGQDEVDAHERYVRMVLNAASISLSGGVPPLEAARELDLGEFAERYDRERVVLNMHRAYADLDEAWNFDIRRAFADAMEYNCGPLRTDV